MRVVLEVDSSPGVRQDVKSNCVDFVEYRSRDVGAMLPVLDMLVINSLTKRLTRTGNEQRRCSHAVMHLGVRSWFYA